MCGHAFGSVKSYTFQLGSTDNAISNNVIYGLYGKHTDYCIDDIDGAYEANSGLVFIHTGSG